MLSSPLPLRFWVQGSSLCTVLKTPLWTPLLPVRVPGSGPALFPVWLLMRILWGSRRGSKAWVSAVHMDAWREVRITESGLTQGIAAAGEESMHRRSVFLPFKLNQNKCLIIKKKNLSCYLLNTCSLNVQNTSQICVISFSSSVHWDKDYFNQLFLVIYVQLQLSFKKLPSLIGKIQN